MQPKTNKVEGSDRMKLTRVLVVLILGLVVVVVAQADDVRILLRHEVADGKAPGTTIALFHESGWHAWGFILQGTEWYELGRLYPVRQNENEYLDVNWTTTYTPTGDWLHFRVGANYRYQHGKTHVNANANFYTPLNGGKCRVYCDEFAVTREVADWLEVGPAAAVLDVEGSGKRRYGYGAKAKIKVDDSALTIRYLMPNNEVRLLMTTPISF